jgi:hypothetical protein
MPSFQRGSMPLPSATACMPAMADAWANLWVNMVMELWMVMVNWYGTFSGPGSPGCFVAGQDTTIG